MMLLPESLQDWLPEGHLAHFIRDAIDGLESVRTGVIGLLLPVLALAACSGLPAMPDRSPSTHFVDTADTAIGRAVRAANPNDGRSGLRTLSDPLEAFAARMLLVRAAERALDVQYYIWRPDTTGTLLLKELDQAAARGVRVRLLLDDNGIAGLDPMLAELNARAHVEVGLFNPFANRNFKALGYLTDLARLNRRMHNKALIADAQAAIVGGRNIGDAYFGADPVLDFVDLDALVTGPIATEVASSFDAFWNSTLAYPLEALVATSPEAQTPLAARAAEIARMEDTTRYAQAVRTTELAAQLESGTLRLDWVPMRLVSDPPEKADGTADPSTWMATDLTVALGPAHRQVDLVSPYFVPGAGGTAALASHPARGVQLRVVTNSLAATDVAAVHAGYARRRADLLRAGVKLYEFKPGPNREPGPRWWPVVSAASLHAKTFSVDRQRVFVGSFNVDPRSVHLNTEMGLVIESPALASAIADGLNRQLPSQAFELRLGEGERLEWIERTETGEAVHLTEPRARLWRRLLVSLLSILPIEWLL